MPRHTSVSVAQAAQELADDGILSSDVSARLAENDHSVSVPEVRHQGFVDPQLSCFVIDASPSMSPHTDAVIAGQRTLIDTLRGSSICRKGQLYVGQWLFSSTIQLLNPLTTLAEQPGDAVPLLDRSTYRPQDGHRTALYEAVFQVLQNVAANIAHGVKQGVRSSFTIGLITDGLDTEGGTDPSDIQKIVEELRGQDYLRTSVVIGIESRDLDRSRISDIQHTLGFDTSVAVTDSASGIRQAFEAASQSAVVTGNQAGIL